MNPILTAIILVGGIGLLCALILVIASRFLSVKVDEKETAVRAVLPGANCGACGYAGCDQYAKALAKGEAKTNLCVVGADAVSRQISDTLGVPYLDVVEMVAYVRCKGNCEHTSTKMKLDGVRSCAAANLMFAGDGKCAYGCLGYGDCVGACPNNAICLRDGIAHVDTRKCTGCGICTRTCPKHLIALFPDKEHVTVSCSNHDKGAAARQNCSAACIACRMCEKNCPTGAITVQDNLAVIDYEKCISCEMCTTVCPDHCIVFSDNSGIHNAPLKNEKK